MSRLADLRKKLDAAEKRGSQRMIVDIDTMGAMVVALEGAQAVRYACRKLRFEGVPLLVAVGVAGMSTALDTLNADTPHAIGPGLIGDPAVPGDLP